MAGVPDRLTRWVRRLGTAASWALLVVILTFLWPSHLGGCTTLTIVTGHSMDPTLQTGDLAISRCGEVHIGDIAVYRPFPDKAPVVIHRVIGGDKVDGWNLKGDNNNFVDPFRPVDSQMKGVMVLDIPKVGLAASVISSPVIWIPLLLFAAAIYVWPRKSRPDTDLKEAEDVPDKALV